MAESTTLLKNVSPVGPSEKVDDSVASVQGSSPLTLLQATPQKADQPLTLLQSVPVQEAPKPAEPAEVEPPKIAEVKTEEEVPAPAEVEPPQATQVAAEAVAEEIVEVEEQIAANEPGSFETSEVQVAAAEPVAQGESSSGFILLGVALGLIAIAFVAVWFAKKAATPTTVLSAKRSPVPEPQAAEPQAAAPLEPEPSPKEEVAAMASPAPAIREPVEANEQFPEPEIEPDLVNVDEPIPPVPVKPPPKPVRRSVETQPVAPPPKPEPPVKTVIDEPAEAPNAPVGFKAPAKPKKRF